MEQERSTVEREPSDGTERPLRLSDLIDKRALQLIELGLSQDLGSATALLEPAGDGQGHEYVTDAAGRSRRANFCEYLRGFPDGARACFENDCRQFTRLKELRGPDPKPFYPCHMYLADLAVPVRVAGQLVAVLFSGQRRLRRWQRTIRNRVREIAPHVEGLDRAKLLRMVSRIPLATENQMLRLRGRLEEAAGHIEKFANSRYQLAEALRERERLIADGIHELRAALHGALTEAEYLATYSSADNPLGLSPEITDALDRICQEIYHLRDTTLTRLLAARAEAGEAIPTREYRTDTPHSIADLLAQCARLYDHTATARGISIHVDQRVARAPAFCFDWDSMRLVMVNLLDNAVKYSYEHTYIRLDAWREDASIRIAVENMGTGIPRDELDRVFERFYRARGRDPVRFIWGSGLGLAVAKEIVEDHGGTIWAESQRGGRSSEDAAEFRGYKTTFHVKLPYKKNGEGPD